MKNFVKSSCIQNMSTTHLSRKKTKHNNLKKLKSFYGLSSVYSELLRNNKFIYNSYNSYTQNTSELTTVKRPKKYRPKCTQEKTHQKNRLSWTKGGYEGHMIETISNPEKKRVTLDDFQLLSTIGEGGFGRISLCQEKTSQKIFAIKSIGKEKIKGKNMLHTFTENVILKHIKYTFITEMKYSFQTKNLVCFVMEYVGGGDLFFHLEKCSKFDENRTRFYAAELVLALNYLHYKNIIYRDLKIENILLDSKGHVKLADFGLAKTNMPFGATTKTFCGTPHYMPPEQIKRDAYGTAADWWSLGVVIYLMVVGNPPFDDENKQILYELILTKPIVVPKSLSEPMQRLLQGLLCKIPSARLGGNKNDAYDIMQHPFFHCIDWALLEQKQVVPPFIPHITSATDTKYFDSFDSMGDDSEQYIVDAETQYLFEHFDFQDKCM